MFSASNRYKDRLEGNCEGIEYKSRIAIANVSKGSETTPSERSPLIQIPIRDIHAQILGC